MYKLIGADGKEYGPVTADQVRQWIAQGRATSMTQAAAEGMSEWKSLGAFPEFSLLFTGAPPAAPTPGVIAAQPTRKTNGFAIAGMILGIISVIACCCYGLPFNVLGLIFSIIALSQISNAPERHDGKGMAITGLVLSVLSIVLYLILLFLGVVANLNQSLLK